MANEPVCQLLDDELIFNDWHFIDEFPEDHTLNSSDDESSIEIIEREVLRPTHILKSSDDKSKISNNCRDLPALEFRSVSQLAENNDESKFHSHISVGDAVELLIVLLLGLIGALFLLYLATIASSVNNLIHHGESSTNKMNDQAIINDLFEYLQLTKSNIYSQESPFSWFQNKYIIKEEFNVLTYRLQNKMLENKFTISSKFDIYTELLNHIKPLESNLYALNISELNRKVIKQHSFTPKFILNTLNGIDKISLCSHFKNIDELPYICNDNQNILVILDDTNLRSLYEKIEYSQDEYNKKFNELDSGITNILIKHSIATQKKLSEESLNLFIPDCDNFSKHYKSINHCLKTNTVNCNKSNKNDKEKIRAKEAESPIVTDEIIKINHDKLDSTSKPYNKYKNNNKMMWKKFFEPIKTNQKNSFNTVDKNPNSDRRNKYFKLKRELEHLIKKFKYDFENFYQTYITLESTQEYELHSNSLNSSDILTKNDDTLPLLVLEKHETNNNTSRNNSESIISEPVSNQELISSDSKNNSESIITEPVSNEKVISGDWFSKLSYAREKLRNYYENIRGDWILKRGKAREKLRKNHEDKWFNTKEKYENSDNKIEEWLKFLENKKSFKKFTSQLKNNLFQMKDDFKYKFDKFTDDFKYKYDKFTTGWKNHLKNVKNIFEEWYF